MFHLANLPIIIHFLLEFMPISSFLRRPDVQLHDPRPSREAVLVCQSYAGTLLTLNVLILFYLWLESAGHFGPVGTALTWGLSIYHVFPMLRAWDRMKRRRGNETSQYDIGGGPRGNLIGHAVVFVALVAAGVYGLLL